MLISPAHTHRYRRFADAPHGRPRTARGETWMVSPSFQRTFTAILCQLAWRTVPPPRPPSGCVQRDDFRPGLIYWRDTPNRG